MATITKEMILNAPEPQTGKEPTLVCKFESNVRSGLVYALYKGGATAGVWINQIHHERETHFANVVMFLEKSMYIARAGINTTELKELVPFNTLNIVE